MNQTELADLGTLDYVLGLPSYSAGARIRWRSEANSADNFVSYRYINFHNTGIIHSVLVSSTVRMSNNFYLNLAYNHLFRAGMADTDLYSAGVTLKF